MLKSGPRYGRASCTGAATIEFQIVALFALLPLCLGMLQLALLLAENHHIDHAAFLAARHAAMQQGDLGSARQALVQAGSLLFIDSAPLESANVPQRAAAAMAAAAADLALHARVRVLEPSSRAQQDFAVLRGNERVIPNDGLEYRATALGRQSRITLQQANQLRLEVSWCRPLIVPFARELLLGTLRLVDSDPWHQLCYAAGRVPIRSEGTSPMQSDFRVSS